MGKHSKSARFQLAKGEVPILSPRGRGVIEITVQRPKVVFSPSTIQLYPLSEDKEVAGQLWSFVSSFSLQGSKWLIESEGQAYGPPFEGYILPTHKQGHLGP